MYPRPPIIDFAHAILGIIMFLAVILGSAMIVWSAMPTLVGWLF